MNKQKLYIIKKYIMASSVKEAIRKDKETEVGDVWIDDKWLAETIVEGFKK